MRWRRPHHPPDQGLSLPELLVAMLATSVLVAVVGAVTMGSLRADRTLRAKIGASSDARIAMESVSRELRTATVPAGEPAALVTATTASLSFYTLLQHAAGSTATPLPTLVELFWDAGARCLKQATTPARVLATPGPSGSIYAWDTGRSARCLAPANSEPAPGTAWFGYYTSGTATTPIAVPDGGLSLVDREAVQSVSVDLTVVDPSSRDVTGVRATVRVTLANVALGRGKDA